MDMDLYSGLICPSTEPVRRISFYGAKGNIKPKTLNIWQYDESVVGGMNETALEEYLLPPQGSNVEWKEKANPSAHWTVPYVAGHKYYIRWSFGLDFDSYHLQIIDWLWEDEDSIEFTMPFYETRAAIYFDSDTGRKANMSLAETPEPDQVMGMNNVYNATDIREAEFAVNARDGSGNMKVHGYRCVVNCKPYIPPVDDKDLEKETHLWSDPQTWKNNNKEVPAAGQDVIIESGWNVIYDMGMSPVYNSVTING